MSFEMEHAWFTDGSAKYVVGKRFWKVVSYHPHSEKFLETTGEGKSSQYAELYTAYTALKLEDLGECNLYTDSWSAANGLATWLPTWAAKDWKIHSKEVWGKELRKDIWEIAQRTKVTMFHADAHSKVDTLE